MLDLTDLEKQSLVGVKLRKALVVRRTSLLKKCGLVLDRENTRRDAVLTAILRGQIREVNLLLNDFAIGPESLDIGPIITNED